MGKSDLGSTVGLRARRFAMLLVAIALTAGHAAAQCECPADFDQTGAVGFNDLSVLLGNWGVCDEGVPCPWDIDQTDSVGFNDLSVLLGTWGMCPDTVDDDEDGVPNCADQCPGEDDSLDSDADTVPDCLDICPGEDDLLDSDADTVPDCLDICPGEDDLLDSDTDGTPDCLDGCPDDPDKVVPGICGCGVPDDDTDLDGVADCIDLCPGEDDNLDSDADTVPDCIDLCPGEDDLLDSDTDGTPDCLDGCPDDPDKVAPGICGCGVPDDDTDLDGVADCIDICPGEDDNLDSDTDGTPDCLDGCPDDPDKIEPGICGCGVPDDDTDLDGVADCNDICPGEDDNLDSDTDGTPDCLDGCPDDPDKTEPGVCGCGVPDDDTDLDGVADCNDICPGEDDNLDSDGDTVPDCVDQCPGEDDLLDSDTDGTPDCQDGCPNDPNKTEPGLCGCGVPDTPGCVTAVIFSDDFDRCTLDPAWIEVDPNGGAGFELMGAGTSDAYLAITVPAGVDYDPWIPINKSARLMQPTGDVDFQIEVKFDSQPTEPDISLFQSQGIIVEQDNDNFIRIEFFSFDSQLFFFVATIDGGATNTIELANIGGAVAPLYLRVTRVGNLWTAEYSDDGVTWQGSAAATDFPYDLTVNQVGPHCGSSSNSGTPPPGFTALVDYFFNTAVPIFPEDGAVIGDEEYTFDVQTEPDGTGTVMLVPDTGTYTCGTTVTLTPLGNPGWVFAMWTGDVNSTDDPLIVQAMSDLQITAIFAATATAPRIGDVGVIPTKDAAVITWSTDLLATSVLRAGKSAAYELPGISYDAYVTDHTVVLMGLEPGTTYHFQILSESEMGDAARTIDLTFTTLPPPRAEPAKAPAQTGGAGPEPESGPAAVGRPEKKKAPSKEAPSDDDAEGAEPRERVATPRG